MGLHTRRGSDVKTYVHSGHADDGYRGTMQTSKGRGHRDRMISPGVAVRWYGRPCQTRLTSPEVSAAQGHQCPVPEGCQPEL